MPGAQLGPSSGKNTFTRLLKFEPKPGEKMRRYVQNAAHATATSYDYHAVAPEDADDNDPVWAVVRFDRTVAGLLEVRFRTAVQYDEITVGW